MSKEVNLRYYDNGTLELGCNARIEDTITHILRHTGSVIEEKEGANTLLLTRGEVDIASTRVACVSQHFDNDVLDMLDIVFGLTALCLGNAQANEAVAEVLLDAKVSLAGHGGDERNEVVAVRHGSHYFAISTARLSRMTTTRTWPGYSISSSIC